MEVKLWRTIIAVSSQVRSLLEKALPQSFVYATQGTATMIISTPKAVLDGLRGDVRVKLDELRAELAQHLGEREVYQVLLPLVIYYDELVLRRLSPSEQTGWQLLQEELLQLNDGGDVFYDFIDERLASTDTPHLLFEVLYYCLSDGFLGRYADMPAKIAAYKIKLAARIRLPKLPRSRNGPRASASGAESNFDGEHQGGAAPSGKSDRGRDGAGQRSRGSAEGDHGSRRSREENRTSSAPASTRVLPPLWVGLVYVGTLTLVLTLPLFLVWISNL